MNLTITVNVQNLLAFLEYLHSNGLSLKVIQTYLSSISNLAKLYGLDHSATSSHLISRFMQSISINSKFLPTVRGIFDIKTLHGISMACDVLSDPPLFRSIFLTAFYDFLRMSNIAPHSLKQFNPSVHLLRQDLIFGPPRAHLILKWTKTMQDKKACHVIQLPEINNYFLCPIRALKALLASIILPSTAPLFANLVYPNNQVIDTHIRDVLKAVLNHRNISTTGHGFHTFRHSGATFAFDNNVPLQNIMSHGLWRSSAVWTYLQNASHPIHYSYHLCHLYSLFFLNWAWWF